MSTSATQHRVVVDPETGERQVPDLWDEHIDWLLAGQPSPRTVQEWAGQHGLHPDTVSRWKRHPDFIRRWEAKAQKLNISPERTQAVADAMFEQAVAGDVKAAALYLQFVEKLTPTKRVIVEDGGLEGKSDAEIEAMIRDEVG